MEEEEEEHSELGASACRRIGPHVMASTAAAVDFGGDGRSSNLHRLSALSERSDLLNAVVNFLGGRVCSAAGRDAHGDRSGGFDEQQEPEESCIPIKMQSQQFSARPGEIIDY